MIKAGIVGATGYAGAELLRLLLSHREVKIAAISSFSFEGEDISSVYPNFSNIFSELLVKEEDVIEKSDVIFACLPHGLSQDMAKKCSDKAKVFIDLGADFRLENADDYKTWYSGEYKYPELNKNAVYGLCELYRDKIKNAKIIANPGCYPTSIALALYPALKNNLVKNDNIISDSKSGVTGAGRSLSQKTHYPDCNESFSPYNIAAHRHIPEIEQTLSMISGEKTKITFVPHLLPVNRGILSTIYADLSNTSEDIYDKIYDIYKESYKNEKFVRILPKGQYANIKNIKYSNYCDISIHIDIRTQKLIVVSAIDNMVKGAAGQAIQNMNIVFGFDEACGLEFIPPAF